MQETLKDLVKTFPFKGKNFQNQLGFLKFASAKVNKLNKLFWRKGKGREGNGGRRR